MSKNHLDPSHRKHCHTAILSNHLISWGPVQQKLCNMFHSSKFQLLFKISEHVQTWCIVAGAIRLSISLCAYTATNAKVDSFGILK